MSHRRARIQAASRGSGAATADTLIGPIAWDSHSCDGDDPIKVKEHMARNRKKRGASRVTPRGTRPSADSGAPSPSTEPVSITELRMLVTEATDCVERCSGLDMCETEAQVSCMVGICIASTWSPDGISSAQALKHADQISGPAGVVIAAGIAAYGDPAHRTRAQRLLGEFAEDGVDIPDWIISLAVAEPLQAVKIRDQWDEHCTVVVDFAKPDGSVHALWASLHPYCWGMAYDFAVKPSAEAHDRVLGADYVLEPISLERARSLLASGLEEFDTALSEAGDVEFDHLAHDADLRPLVGQRIDLLPEGDAADVEAQIDVDEVADRAVSTVKDFLAEPSPLGEREEDVSNLVLAMLTFSAACHDSDMVHWTPPRVTWFLEKFLFMCWSTGEDGGEGDSFDPSDEWLATTDSALRRWLRLAAERRGADAELLEANLAAAQTSMRALRRKVTGSPLPVIVGAAQWN